MSVNYRFNSLEDFLVSHQLSIDGVVDDGWGATYPVKGREIEATVLFADIPAFTRQTKDLSSTETLAFVNNFFAWITAEALTKTTGIIDKYIGDEVMILFSPEFGAVDHFGEALEVARWMGERDALDYAPQIGLASGQVTVGYVGTPLRYNCSAFGHPVALAARCAKSVAPTEPAMYSTRMAFPASAWGENRSFDSHFSPRRYTLPSGQPYEYPQTWVMSAPRLIEPKNVGALEIVDICNTMLHAIPYTAEQRARDTVDVVTKAGRYWPTATKGQIPNETEGS